MTPPRLRSRKNALKDAFEGLSEMEAWILVHGSPREVLAQKILTAAKIAGTPGQSAVETLAASRLHAHDHQALRRLEKAYQLVLGVPLVPPAPAAPTLPAATPAMTPAPPANLPTKAARKPRAGRK